MISLLLALPAHLQGPDPKALVLFFDGFLPEVITPEVMPVVHGLMTEGAWSLRARCEDTTISGSGWSTFLTGVHRDKHGVPDNEFATPNFGPYPLFFSRLKERDPQAVCAIAQSWRPIERHLVAPGEPDFSFYADYDLASDDYFDGFSVDALCADAALRWLQLPIMDCVVVMFGESDGVGHLEHNAHYDASDLLYRRKLAELDAHVGRLVAAVREREKSRLESWLIAIHADHAGKRGEGHGRNTPAHREAPFILHGPGIARGEIWPPPKSPDLVASVLNHFGVEPDPAWGLDGRAVGFSPNGPALAWFERNLLVNGDAEAERGFSAASAVDASTFGWDDPGAVGVLRQSDGRQVFHAPTAARMTQRVDLLPLRPWFESAALELEFDGRFEGARASLLHFDEEGAPLPGPAPTLRWVEVVLEFDDGGWADDLSLIARSRSRAGLPEWRPLFDGVSLAGWTNVNVDPGTFTVRDGMIVCTGRPTGEIRTERTYENFVAEFEYQHLTPGGNAGFFIWSDALPAPGAPFIRSVEVQVIDGWESENWTSHGDVFAIWGATMRPDRPHPAGWERCLPNQRRALPAGSWNHFRIVAVDGIVQHWVNGAPVSGGRAVSPRRGYLCLESEGAEVWFRNLRILELPDTGAAGADLARGTDGFAQMEFTAPPAGWTRADWRWVAAADAQPWRSRDDYASFDIFFDVRAAGPALADVAAPPADAAAAQFIVPPLDRIGVSDKWRRLQFSCRAGVWRRVLLDGQPLEFVAPLPSVPARGPIALLPLAGTPCEFANAFVRTVPE